MATCKTGIYTRKQTMNDLKMLWDNYGYIGVGFYILLVQIWPFFKDKLFPEQIKERRLSQEWERKNSERLTVAMESMASSQVASNEKLNSIVQLQIEHDRTMREAIIKMTERTTQLLVNKGKTK